MVRAAAKNHPSVAVVVDPARYDEVVAAAAGEGFTFAERRALAAAAFEHTARYDLAVATWFAEQNSSATFPGLTGGIWERANVLRYGRSEERRVGKGESGSGLPSA